MKPAREMFELHPLEIIYLTALIGETSFPGLEIDLKDESERNLRSLMDAQMRSLEVKGYLEVDFAGLAKVNEVLHRGIAVASSCKSYFCQLMHTNQQTCKVFYFVQDEVWFELEHQPESNTYKLQEIYALHELMYQVIERIPLVWELSDKDKLQKAINKEVDFETWVGKSLLAGAFITSLAEIQCITEEAQVIRELNLLIHEDQMWLLSGGEEDASQTTQSLSTVVNELCNWLQEA